MFAEIINRTPLQQDTLDALNKLDNIVTMLDEWKKILEDENTNAALVRAVIENINKIQRAV